MSGRKTEFVSSGRRDRQLRETRRKLPAYAERKIRKAKAQHKLSLAIMVKDNNKCFYKYINGKRRAKRESPSFTGCMGGEHDW